MNRRIFGLCFTLATTLLFNAHVNARPNDAISAFIQSEVRERQIPGLQMVVIRDGVPVFSGVFGVASIQYRLPVSDHSVFSINSATKSFTGVAVMQLVEQGKIDLQAPVSRYLNDLPQHWQAITVMQLLAHTSGLPDILDPETSNLLPGGPAAVWKTVQTLPMQSLPGQRFSYNQTNYVLLEKIIAQQSGEPFLQFVQRRQFDAIGMPSSTFGDSRDVIRNKANSYVLAADGKTLRNVIEDFPVYTRAGAGINSNVRDLSKWIQALQQGRLLKPDSLKQLWTPATLVDNRSAPWAMGWPAIRRAQHRAVAGIGGGRSAFYIYPEDRLAIIILTNLAGSQPEQLMDTVAGFYLPALKQLNGGGHAIYRLRQIIEQSGYAGLERKLQQVMEQYAVSRPTQSELNSWGYRLLAKQQNTSALAVFDLAVTLYPDNADAHDSLAEGYEANQETGAAIRHYRRSLELNPENRHAASRLAVLSP
ncbi:serine hydrolase domain-containing protein [Massilia sp. BJB1822]|uniref:serine hydrolase domain-containing protein n=1 Tax=Massilia sp. BJB1822 TaxID=2744470 RepID=UPI001594A612|nr:serine hydrolase domain-containing protein [Massilia sp. BJB1822]NVE00668.1 serine hydrolase [Massilia sp. BJB1822]